MAQTNFIIILAIFNLLAASHGLKQNERSTGRSFPAEFIFGTATAAYQIEGAWNADGKGWSMWDHLCRTNPDGIIDNTNGDIAVNSYYMYKRDIKMLNELGVQAHRFSISWPRILPYGRDYVNPLGVAYYNAVIDELLANDIVPFVTIYHWDLPQNLNELGGWLNEDIVDWFGNYSRILFQLFGDRVKHWLTINEPYIHCSIGYGGGPHAPKVNIPGVSFYECGRNVLLAHARAYHIYNEEFRASQGGEVGLVFSMDWALPSSNSEDDVQAAKDVIDFHLGIYLDPVLSAQGNYPQGLIDRVAAASAAEGLNASRLRHFTQDEADFIRGTIDFMALNHYSTDLVYRNASLAGRFDVPSVSNDLFVGYYADPSWPTSESPWIQEYAPGLYNLLMYIKDTYDNPKLYITENGISSSTGLYDTGRVQYFRNYTNAVLDAINDGADIRGYFAWSLMDNFEWAFGYTMKFGLYEVDMEDPERRRTPRQSALVYKEIIRSRTIDYSYNPDPFAEAESATDGSFSTSASLVTICVTVMWNIMYLLLASASTSHGLKQNERSTGRSFPAEFIFGTATAAYQIEGAWNADGKGWSMWDHLCRTNPDGITDNTNGDIAANSYYLYKRDIEMLNELGIHAYRLSISWPRILPYGRDYVNPLGVAYYNAVIDELLANDIVPFVTIYHWDLPQNLNELGGWLNEDIVDWFGNYSRILFQLFGDRVKHWLTINEPYVHCSFGYGGGSHAPNVNIPGVGLYECGRNILLAHARTYHIYDEEFRASQGGEIGLVFSMDWVLPSSDSEDDLQAVSDFIDFKLGIYLDPILSAQGNYPQGLIDRVAAASAAEGLNASRLRHFTQDEADFIRGTIDFVALNHYSTDFIYRNDSLVGRFDVPSVSNDLFVGSYADPSWPTSESPWIQEYAPGLYNLLMYIKDTYDNPKLYITENGISSTTGLYDPGRVQYYRNYLNAVLDAINDGADIRGYFAWSLMDNFEWSFGYTMRFGLYEVDMEDPERRRTPRQSALVYKEIIRSRTIDYSYNPDPFAEAESATDGSFSTSASLVTICVTVMWNVM